jgi:hypothetical protein
LGAFFILLIVQNNYLCKNTQHMKSQKTAYAILLLLSVGAISYSIGSIIGTIRKMQQPTTSTIDSCEALAHEMQQRIDRIDSTVKEIKAMLQPIDTVDGNYGSKVDSTRFSTK